MSARIVYVLRLFTIALVFQDVSACYGTTGTESRVLSECPGPFGAMGFDFNLDACFPQTTPCALTPAK